MYKLIALILALAAFTQAYEYGIAPSNVDYMDLMAQWEDFKRTNITEKFVPNAEQADKYKGTMARAMANHPEMSNGEYMGYSMVLAAYLEEDDVLFSKLWNYVKWFCYEKKNSRNLMPWWIEYNAAGQIRSIKGLDGTAADGCMDIGFALDRAAIRWPGKGYDAAAERYINDAKFHYQKFPTLKVQTVKGAPRGYYLNYLAVAHWDRFTARTGNADWAGKVLDNAYGIMDYSYKNYELPAWFVDQSGKAISPNDPFDTQNLWRWDAGPSRVAWRIGAHYLTTGHADAKKWVDQITKVFVAGGADESVEKVSGGYNSRTGESQNWGARPTTMSGAGVCAMGAGNQFIADGAWDFLARFEIKQSGMDAATAMLGMLIMSGMYNTTAQHTDMLPTITVPPAPENVQGSPQTSSTVRLSWNKVPEAFKYIIEKKENGSFAPVDTINRNSTSATVALLEPQTSYDFRVSATNTKGTASSSPVSVTTPAPSSGELVVAINVGGAAYTGTDGVNYLADQYYTEGKPNPRGIEIEGTEDDEVYSSERWGVFSYAIPLDPGDYVVTLMFAEGFHTDVNKRVFDIAIEGNSTAKMKGIDIVGLAGGPKKAHDLEFDVTSEGPTLDMQFTRLKDNASLSGIRVRRSGTVGTQKPVDRTVGMTGTPRLVVGAHPKKGLRFRYAAADGQTAALSLYSPQGKLLRRTTLTAGKTTWIRGSDLSGSPVVYRLRPQQGALFSGIITATER